MSITVSSPNLNGVQGNVLSIKRGRMDGPSYLGTTDLYFILTDYPALYFSTDLRGSTDPVSISLAGVFSGLPSGIPIVTGIDVFIAHNCINSDTESYPVVFLYVAVVADAVWGNNATPTEQVFICALLCTDIPNTDPSVLYQTIETVFPLTGGSYEAIDSWKREVQVLGYAGGQVPSDTAMIFSLGVGLFSFSFPEFGAGQVNALTYLSTSPPSGAYNYWEVVFPNFSVEVPLSSSYLPWRFPNAANDNVPPTYLFVRDRGVYTNGVLRLMTAELRCSYGNVGNERALIFTQVTPGYPLTSVVLDENDTPDYLVRGNFLMDGAALSWINGEPSIPVIAQGWGLSGNDDPTGWTTPRLYGSESLVLVSVSGGICVLGDGAGTSTYEDPDGQICPDVLVCGAIGDPNDAAAAHSASTPMYRNGVVGVSRNKYVMWSADALTWGTTPQLTLPAQQASTFNRCALRYYGEGAPFMSEPEGFYLLASYVSDETSDPLRPQGHLIVDRYYSSDGGYTWSSVSGYPIDVTDYVRSNDPQATNTTVLVETVSGSTEADSVPLLLFQTNEQIRVLIGFSFVWDNNGTPTTKYQEFTLYTGTGSTGTPGDLSLASATIADADTRYRRTDTLAHYCDVGTLVLRGDKTPYKVLNADGTETAAIATLPDVFTNSVPGFGYEYAVEWNGVYPQYTDMGSAGSILGDLCLSLGTVSNTSTTPQPMSDVVTITMLNTFSGVLSSQVGTTRHPAYNNDPCAVYVVERLRYSTFGDLRFLTMANYTVADCHTDPIGGTAVFLVNPAGAITHVGFTSGDVVVSYNPWSMTSSLWTDVAPCGFRPLPFVAIDTELVCDGNSPTDSSTLYITSREGEIWSISLGTGSGILTQVSSALYGTFDLRIAYSDGLWGAVYSAYPFNNPLQGFPATLMSYSSDLQSWTLCIDLNDYPATAWDSGPSGNFTPLDSSGNRECRIVGTDVMAWSYFHQ